MRARLAVTVSIATACGRSVLGDVHGDGGATSGDDSSGSVGDSPTGGDPSGQPPPADTTLPTTVGDDDVTSEPPDPSGPDPSIDTGWLPDFASACGNGELGAGEECDDGNYEDDDACTSSCTIPFEIEWTVTQDGSAHGFDAARDVVVDELGQLYVVGTVAQEGQGRDVWLQQYNPDGSSDWSYTWDGADHRDDVGYALAITASGIIVVGSTESDVSGDDIVIMHILWGSLEEAWVTTVDGPGSGPEDYDDADEAVDVIPMDNGEIIVAGHIRVGPLDWDAWIRRLDGNGNELWTMTYDGPAGGQDRMRSLALASDGTIRGLAEVEYDDGIRGAVLVLDEFDMLADTIPIDTIGAGMVRNVNDAYLVAGSDDDEGWEPDYDVRSYSAAFAPQWSAILDSANDEDTAHGIAIGPDNLAYVVGASGRAGEQENGRLYAIDHSSEVWWGDEHNGPADLGDSFEAVAVDPFGDVYVVGFESVLGEQTNALVRKYHPL